MDSPVRIEITGPARSIIETLQVEGHQAFVVGGAVRDQLLGLRAVETDIATSATPAQLQSLFPRTHAIGESFGVILVVEGDEPHEVATFRSDGSYSDGRRPSEVRFAGLEDDARRRDFTVNAIYYDPVADEIHDPMDGQADLRARLLRAIGEADARFAEDHLRLLRCVRFAVQLGFEIEVTTWEAVRGHAANIERISAERIRHELDRILKSPEPARGLKLLLESGLLERVLPEIAAMVGVEQPPEYHPEGDVFVHTSLALEKLERRTTELVWGVLLHDVGKPKTYKVKERIRFDGHVEVGCEMAREILRRLRFDNETVERVVELVHLHLKFSDAPQMRPSTLKRFLREPHFADHLALHRADCLASHGDLSLYEFCVHELADLRAEELRPEPLLSGKDLLAMGYREGPLLGTILDELETAQLEGSLQDVDAAREWVRRHWPN